MNRFCTTALALLTLGTVTLPAVTLPAWGQGVTTASIRGTVYDETGSTLPGANVVAVHLPTGAEYGAATNVEGTFNLRNLRVGGPYRVAVSFVGFEPFVREDIELTLGEVEVLDVTLSESATVLGEIEVVAGGLFDSERNGVSTSIDEELINDIPTVGRDLADFTRLTPQAYVENDDDDGPAISIAGQNNRYNSIYIDGVVNNDVFGLSAQGTNGGQTGSTPISIDVIEEFQINLSPFDVTQSGFTGGAINAVTRSGTNRFTGSAYYFFRNENLAGNTPGPLVELGRPDEALASFTNAQYGARLGGPIVRDRLFFFTSIELTRSETPQPFIPYEVRPLEDLNTLRNVLVEELGYEPGDFGDKISTLDDDKVFARLDWNISRDHKISGRYSYTSATNEDAFATDDNTVNFDNNAELFPNETHFGSVELNSTFGSNFANSLLVGITSVSDDRGIKGDPFPLTNINDRQGEVAGDIFVGPEQYSTANLLNQDIVTVTNNFNWFVGSHTLTFGVHGELYSLSNLFIPTNFGFYEYDSFDDYIQSVCAASFRRDGAFASETCRNVDFGGTIEPAEPAQFRRSFSLVDQVAGDETEAIGAFDAYQVGFYVQDEFQVNPRFRLTAGLRVDVPEITNDPRFAPDVFETTVPALEAAYDLDGALPGETPGASLYWAPRLGFNLDLSRNQRLQLRGGVGVFTGRVPFVWPGGMFLNNGVNTGEVLNFSGTLPNGEPIPFVPNPQEALTAEDFGLDVIPSGRLDLFEDDFRYPRVLRTSLGLDYQLPFGWVGTLEGQYTNTIDNILVQNVNLQPSAITTLGGPASREVYAAELVRDSRTGLLEIDASANQIDPRYTGIYKVSSTGEGYTFNLTAQVQKQFDQALGLPNDIYFNASYSYGEAYAVNDGTSSQVSSLYSNTEVEGTAPNALELSRSDFSLGHRVLGGFTYRQEFLNALATKVSLFYVGESGRPFSYTIDNSDEMLGANTFDVALLYVPEDASELRFTGTPEEQAAKAARLDDFIASNDYLSDRRGGFAERNGDRTPFEHIFDLKLTQEVFADVGPRRARAEVTLDVFNLGNLLNSDWGIRYDGIGAYEVLSFQGFEDTAEGLVPVYDLRFNPDVESDEDLFEREVKDEGTYSSRWQMRLGFRVTF